MGVDRIVARAVARRVSPGAVLLIGNRDGTIHTFSAGRQSWPIDSPTVTKTTIYDLASLTKAVATTSAAMALQAEGRLSLDAPVSRYIPELTGGEHDIVRVRDLLTHSAGLPAWAPLYRDIRGTDAFVRRISVLDLEYPPGTRSLYSDLGMALLGVVIERASGRTLDAFARERVFEPLGMTDTGFRPANDLLARIAPTSACPWRGRLVHGEVRDENACALGGVAGHAGLFSTAVDLGRFARAWLNGGVLGHRRVVPAEVVERFTSRCPIPGSTRTLGWETPAGDPWVGKLWSERAYLHTGNTGTLLAVDPEYDVFIILLTNSGPSDGESTGFRELRREVCDLTLSLVRSSRRAR